MGRGLSDLQRDILKLADMRRQKKNLEPVRFRVYLIREAPEKFTEIYAGRLIGIYRRFVPERKTDSYFNPGLRVRDVVDLARHMNEILIGKDDDFGFDEEWQADMVAAAPLFQGWGINNLIYVALSLSVAASYRFSRDLKLAGIDPLPESEKLNPPVVVNERLWFRFDYGDYDSYAEAKNIQTRIAAVLSVGHAFVSGETPKEWHVTLNDIMADCCGLRQYALRDGDLNGGRAFDHSLIDKERYNTIRATVTKACKRLEDRNLVFRTGDRETFQSAAIAITTDGLAAIATDAAV
jgi:hypothetical protein